jgi:hypothetical protein
MSREDIEEAIEVLEDASADMLMETGDENYYVEAIAVLRQALETEKQEPPSDGPVAWSCQCGRPYTVTCISNKPSRQWVGLIDDVVFELADTNLYEGGKNFGVLAFAKAIEQALKEKNS